MAEKSTFFNSVNGDRKYKAEDMASHFAKVITNGVMPEGTQLQVIEGDGMNVAVSAGSAWINGYAYHNDANFVLPIDPADGALNRVDRIVVRWSKLARSINLTVLKGKPASSATAPEIVRNADYYDLSIATINVNKGITAITQALITDTRMDSDVCGFVSSLIQPDTSGWFVQFETAFNEWFDGVKDTLGDNAAGQLQNQINQLKALENELPYDLATTLGLDPADNPKMKDALNKIKSNVDLKDSVQLGDIKATARQDIKSDNRFILCDGRTIEPTNYPELINVMKFWYYQENIAALPSPSTIDDFYKIGIIDNKLVFIGEPSYSLDLNTNTWIKLSDEFSLDTVIDGKRNVKFELVNESYFVRIKQDTGMVGRTYLYTNTGFNNNFVNKYATSYFGVFSTLTADSSSCFVFGVRGGSGNEKSGEISLLDSSGNFTKIKDLTLNTNITDFSDIRFMNNQELIATNKQNDTVYYSNDLFDSKFTLNIFNGVRGLSNLIKIENNYYVGVSNTTSDNRSKYGLYKSTNGTTWEKTFDTSNGVKYIYSSDKRKNILITTTNKLYLSEDYGVSFNEISDIGTTYPNAFVNGIIYRVSGSKIKQSSKDFTIPDAPNHYLKVRSV